MLRYVLVPTVIAPTLYAFISRIQRSGFGRYLALNQRIISHKVIALGIIEASLAHAIGHYFYNKENYLKQTGITGVIMLGILAMPLAGVYFIHWLKPNMGGYGFSLAVKRPHQIGTAGFLIVYGLHTPDGRLMPTASAILFLLILV